MFLLLDQDGQESMNICKELRYYKESAFMKIVLAQWDKMLTIAHPKEIQFKEGEKLRNWRRSGVVGISVRDRFAR